MITSMAKNPLLCSPSGSIENFKGTIKELAVANKIIKKFHLSIHVFLYEIMNLSGIWNRLKIEFMPFCFNYYQRLNFTFISTGPILKDFVNFFRSDFLRLAIVSSHWVSPCYWNLLSLIFWIKPCSILARSAMLLASWIIWIDFLIFFLVLPLVFELI